MERNPVEGGYYVELNKSDIMIDTPERGEGEKRCVYSTIHYLMV